MNKETLIWLRDALQYFEEHPESQSRNGLSRSTFVDLGKSIYHAENLNEIIRLLNEDLTSETSQANLPPDLEQTIIAMEQATAQNEEIRKTAEEKVKQAIRTQERRYRQEMVRAKAREAVAVGKTTGTTDMGISQPAETRTATLPEELEPTIKTYIQSETLLPQDSPQLEKITQAVYQAAQATGTSKPRQALIEEAFDDAMKEQGIGIIPSIRERIIKNVQQITQGAETGTEIPGEKTIYAKPSNDKAEAPTEEPIESPQLKPIKESLSADITTELKQHPYLEELPTLDPVKNEIANIIFQQASSPTYNAQELSAEIEQVVRRTEIPQTEAAQIAKNIAVIAESRIAEIQQIPAEPTVKINLAEAAKESVSISHAVPDNLRSALNAEIVETLTKINPTMKGTPEIAAAGIEITQATIIELSTRPVTPPEEPPQASIKFQTAVKQGLETAKIHAPSLEILGGYSDEILASIPAARIVNDKNAYGNKGEGIIKAIPLAKSIEELGGELQKNITVVLSQEPNLAKQPELAQALAVKTKNVMVAQALSPEGYKTESVTPAIKKLYEDEGIGLKINKVNEIVTKIEKNSVSTISDLGKAEKPLSMEMVTKIKGTVQQTSLGFYVMHPTGMVKVAQIYFQRGIYAGPMKLMLIALPEARNSREFQLMVAGIRSGDIDTNIRLFSLAGMSSKDPTLETLIKQREKLIAFEKQHPTMTRVFNGYSNLDRLKGRVFYLPQSGMAFQRAPVFPQKDYNYRNNPIFRSISNRFTSRLSIQSRFVNFVTGGRFSSFGGVGNSFYRGTIGRVVTAFGKNPVIGGAMKAISGAFLKNAGLQLASKGLAPIVATLTGIGGPIGAAIGLGLTALSFVAKALGIDTKKLSQVLFGAAIAGGLAIAAGGSVLVGGAIAALGAIALAATLPAIAGAVGGAIAGVAAGVPMVMGAMAIGAFSAAPVGLAICIGLIVVFLFTLFVIIVASGAFILPRDLGVTTPWDSYPVPINVPRIPAPDGLLFQWPFDNQYRSCSSNFGYRIMERNGVNSCEYHKGIDISGGGIFGTEIHPVANGSVFATGYNGVYGNYVIIDHGSSFYTIYGHMMEGGIAVAANDKVTFTTTLGYVGSTGDSTGPHLHLAFSSCGTIACFGNPNFTPQPCAYLNCDPTSECQYRDKSTGCPGL